DEDVVERRKRRRLLVIGQGLPFNAFFPKRLLPGAALFIIPRMRPGRFEGQQARRDPASAQFAQVGQDLRLRQMLPQSEITEIECPHQWDRVQSVPPNSYYGQIKVCP